MIFNKFYYLLMIVIISSCSLPAIEERNDKNSYNKNGLKMKKERVAKKIANLKPSDIDSFDSEYYDKNQQNRFKKILLKGDQVSNDKDYTDIAQKNLSNNSLHQQEVIDDINETEIIDLSEIIDDNGQYVAQFKVGNPYQDKAEGNDYKPLQQNQYQEIGIASWYGNEFKGRKTANGEIYNPNALTAAHRTLPMPSWVKITNLDNNKSIIARVNDRGPFSKKRIIDVSQEVATRLGFKNIGTAKVKVELLPKTTAEILKKLQLK